MEPTEKTVQRRSVHFTPQREAKTEKKRRTEEKEGATAARRMPKREEVGNTTLTR